jgi:hypothetical protein
MGYPAIGVPGVTAFPREWFDLFKGVQHVEILFVNDTSGDRQAVNLRAQFCMHGIRATASHPNGVKDMNDLLKKFNQERSL